MSKMSKGEAEELKALRAERKRIIEKFGHQGQYHPMGRMIGGLNPAAMRLHSVRGRIAEIEAAHASPKATLTPKGSGRGWDKRGGLLYDITFGIRTGMIGRSQGAPPHEFYIVEGGNFKSGGYKTLGLATKAFEQGK
jgi:hypothetical protein